MTPSGRRLDSGCRPPRPSDPVVTVSASRRYTIGALRVSSPHPRDYMDLGAPLPFVRRGWVGVKGDGGDADGNVPPSLGNPF